MEDNFQEKRLEQIMKLDANALLSTIRDLEHKLSSYQRYDRPPPWVTILEQRIDQLEKWQQAFPLSGGMSKISVDFPGESKVGLTEDIEEKGGTKESGFSLGKLSSPSLFHNEQNISLLEQRILAKVKTDLALKLENISLQFQDQLLNNSLEMDRLQKLLAIRPTTSELQQIVLSVQTVEENSSKQISSIYHTLQNKIKDSVSSEMIVLLNELKSHQQYSNEKMESISKLISSYARELEDLQKNEEKSFRLFEDVINSQKQETQKNTEHLQEIISAEIETKFNFNQEQFEKGAQELKLFQRALAEEREQNQRQFSRLDEKITNDTLKLRNELHDINETIQTTSGQVSSLEGELTVLSENFKMEVSDGRRYRERTDDVLLQQKLSTKEVQGILKEFQEMDLFSRLPRCEESILKSAQEIANVRASISAILQNDLPSVNDRCSLLEEQVNQVLPKLIQTEAMRVNAIIKDIDALQSNQAIFNNRLTDDEELINNLLPVQQKIKTCNEKVERFEADIASFKSLIETSIDANTEIIRRIEEMEEKFETMDDMINHRMNAIRDTLMEALLEKQYETSNMLKNMKSNIELMSTAGESTPASSIAVGPPPIAKLSKMSSNVGKAFLDTTDSQNSAPVLRGAVTSVVAMPKKQASYRRPTMSGAVVQGSALANGGSSNNGHSSSAAVNPSSTYSVSSNANTFSGGNVAVDRSVYMTDSFSTGPATPRTLSGDDIQSHPSSSMPNMRPARSLSPPAFGAGKGISEQSNAEPEDHSPFDDNAFNHFLDNYNPSVSQINNTSQAALELSSPHQSIVGNNNDTGSVVTQLSDTFSYATNNNDNPHHSLPSTRDGQPSHSSVAAPSMGRAQVSKATSKDRNRNKAAAATSSIPLTQPQSVSRRHNDIAPLSPTQNRSELLSVEYSHLMQDPISFEHSLSSSSQVNFREVQLLADLCLNYEEISMKKKRLTSLPPVLCHTVIEVTQTLAERIAVSSDFDMVEQILGKMMDENIHHLSEIQYDETFVITRREQRTHDLLTQMSQCITQFYYQQQRQQHASTAAVVSQTIGAVRTDARQLFFSLVKKSLELFLTKHNQILVVGNSRLGRVKIPTCIACDRPLLEKSRLEGVNGGGSLSPSTSHQRILPSNATAHAIWALDRDFSPLDPHETGEGSLAIGFHENSQAFPSIVQEGSLVTTTTTTTAMRLHSARLASSSARMQQKRLPVSAKGASMMSSSSSFVHRDTFGSDHRPKTSGGSRSHEQAYVMKAGFKMPQRPNSSIGAAAASHSEFPSLI